MAFSEISLKRAYGNYQVRGRCGCEYQKDGPREKNVGDMRGCRGEWVIQVVVGGVRGWGGGDLGEDAVSDVATCNDGGDDGC